MIYTGDLLNSNVFSLQKVLGNSIEIMQWNVLGLPSDTHSIENAIIMRYCFIITNKIEFFDVFNYNKLKEIQINGL